jgi:hypothetical protein
MGDLRLLRKRFIDADRWRRQKNQTEKSLQPATPQSSQFSDHITRFYDSSTYPELPINLILISAMMNESGLSAVTPGSTPQKLYYLIINTLPLTAVDNLWGF